MFDTSKLLLKNKSEMVKMDAKFKSNLALEKLFSSIPEKIDLLKISALISIALIIEKTLNGGFSRENTDNFIKNDKRSKSIIYFSNIDFDESNLSQILLNCTNESLNKNITEINENLDVNDILKTISGINDIDKKIDSKKSKKLRDIISLNIAKTNFIKETIESQIDEIGKISANAIFASNLFSNNIDEQIKQEKQKLLREKEEFKQKIQSYNYMLQHIIYSTKDLFKTYHPSKIRIKYIQRMLRNMYSLIKEEYDELTDYYKPEYKKILNALKQIDDILIAIALITTIYINNRLKLVKKSRETLKELSSDIICLDVQEPFDVSVNKVPFQVNLNCPESIDDVIVPHVPLSEKLNNISCEVTQNEENVINAETKDDLTTIAIIKNNKKDSAFNSLITKDSFVNQKTKIASLDQQPIFSPIEGYVDNIKKDEIVIRDISDPAEDYLISQINLLNEKYERLNSVKSFLKNYYVNIIYPEMLSISAVDDASTYDEDSGVYNLYNFSKLEFSLFNKNYEKQIKNITGKDNVEKNAKNETPFKIKEDIEKQEEIFYNKLKLLKNKNLNLSKKIKAKSYEYNLFDYYSFDIGNIFNSLENPDKLEIEFRDTINEFIRRRFIIDGYDKKKFENKLNDAIKDIEKGASSGNWFKKAIDVYNTKKSIRELKNWLSGLANKNKKLEGNEKVIAVNRILFLFDLYFNIDKIVQKYSIVKKETTSKKETIKEGNYIGKFTADLWKDYENIPKEIKEIEKIIDRISLFSSYSIIDYEGKYARLYSISDESKCESKETDPYINPKSKYEYKDIEYWLKYCSYATLASVSNPATGWSTGWIIPTPILFPVVYVPVKSIMTKFGFIVIGISICGIYIFPWSLFVNFSTKYSVPFADPTTLLKKEIEALKKEISQELVNLKISIIKPQLNKIKLEIEQTNKNIKKLKEDKENNKKLKPEKYIKDKDGNFEITSIESGIKTNLNYINDYKNWLKKEAEINELIITENIKLWKLQIKAKIFQDAKKIEKEAETEETFLSLNKSQKFIETQLNKLSIMNENVDKILSALPIALHPETVNFGMTLKNPKPIINISSELDDNIDDNILDKINKKFKLKNSDMLSSNYEKKLSESIINYDIYKKDLLSSMSSIIVKDTFPHYSLLSFKNIAWLNFLYKDFVVVGARTYGFPGFPPLNI